MTYLGMFRYIPILSIFLMFLAIAGVFAYATFVLFPVRIKDESFPKAKKSPQLAQKATEHLYENGDPVLKIPRLNIKIPIVQGDSEQAMVNGVWLRPGSALPDQQGNIVLAGHRLRMGKSLEESLFFLDRVVVGDEIHLRWNNSIYLFFVVAVTIVSATDSRAELPLLEKTLTLYTCTPLWSSSQRLIIRAKPP